MPLRDQALRGQEDAEGGRHGDPEADGEAPADDPPLASGSGVAGAGAGSFVALGPSTMYGRIVFTWSVDRIWPQAGMKMTPFVPGSGIEPSISTERSSLTGTSSSGLRRAGTVLSAVFGFGAGGGVASSPTCPWQSMQA